MPLNLPVSLPPTPGFPASRVIPLGPVRQRSTSPGRALPGLDGTQYRFGVQKRQSSFRMGGIEPGWWLPPQALPDTHERSVCSSLYESHNPSITHLHRSTMIAESVPFSSDKRYATTHVKGPPQLQKTGAVRVLAVSHGFVYEPYALHEKISWWLIKKFVKLIYNL
ncbi:unnamed protein product [Brassica napus]|uniref:(rape) hypothetical protein n=1 Tax=Brassica napus TaxID=3708 RepID=A0A816IJV0_BRANA|nr:unnamed protein product [Brassica napus]